METVQAFVGCALDLGATRRVMDLARNTKKALDAAGGVARWVPPPNVHITLKYLGDIDAGLVAPVSDALAGVARRSSGLRLNLGGLGAFPSGAEPRVLFVEIARGAEALSALAKAVEDAMFELGFAREKRPFYPHVTIARVQSFSGGVGAMTPAHTDCGAATLGELTLYRSDRLRPSVEYPILSRHWLGGEPREARPEPRGR